MSINVLKRDGTTVGWDTSKIALAVQKAAKSVKHSVEEHTSQYLANDVAKSIWYTVGTYSTSKKDKGITIEDIQNEVEKELMKRGLYDIAKAYILYRDKRSKVRDAKKSLGIKDDLKLSYTACKTLYERYLRKNDSGTVYESTSEMFRRVARSVAVDSGWDSTYFNIMSSLFFLPNSPTMMNAGYKGSLSACYVLAPDDTLESIADVEKYAMLVLQAGGGTGFSFSRLRPEGSMISSTHGNACGPIRVLKHYNSMSIMITQGGKRRGANMGVLRVDHPDIYKFISCKEKDKELDNFNLSVGITDEFMEKVVNGDTSFKLRFDSKGIEKTVDAQHLFNDIAFHMWYNGDPGILFLDTINRSEVLPQMGIIEGTNPCGEVPAQPFVSCNLGSINLSRMIKDGKVDTELLKAVTYCAVRFLDDVITKNTHPVKIIEEMTLKGRKIGLGVTGLHHAMIKCGIAYGTDDSLIFAEDIMRKINVFSKESSVKLADERGAYPVFYDFSDLPYRRNATTTSVAPAGTLHLITNSSQGIEPILAPVYERRTEYDKWVEADSVFEDMLMKENIYSDELLMKVFKNGLESVSEIPDYIKKLFMGAYDLTYKQHIDMQSVIQKHVDLGVSKTINMKNTASIEDVKSAIIIAWQAGLKGFTVYRYGSRQDQIINISPTSNAICEVRGGSCG